jgi:outer membrane protein assembly factor BamB
MMPGFIRVEKRRSPVVNRAFPVLSVALIGVCIVVGAMSAGDSSNDWPSWRGPNYNGVVPEADPPVEWSETDNVRWKVELPGPGHATPVVWDDRIYVLSAVRTENTAEPAEAQPGEDDGASWRPEATLPSVLPASMQQQSQEQQQPQQSSPQRRRGGRPEREKPTHVYKFVVSAHDRGTGKTIWQTVVKEEVPHESGHQTASQASASPVTDGEYVWASFGSRGLYCLNKNGKVVWAKDLGQMKTRNEFGEGSSPVLHGDTLVLNWDHEGDSFIVALDKRTGEQRWKVPREEPTSWSTPLGIEDGGRALVVVSAANRVRAYDLKTGDVVWNCGGLGVNCIPTPVEDGGVLWVMSGYREAAGMAIRYAGAKGDISDSEAVLWKVDKGLSYVPSPVLYDGKLYFFQRFSNVLSCYDLKTGKVHYTEQRVEGVGNIYASPVGASGRIYVLDREGMTAVFRHGETFEMLATNKLDDAFDASPVIVGDELYLRGHKYLYKVAQD